MDYKKNNQKKIFLFSSLLSLFFLFFSASSVSAQGATYDATYTDLKNLVTNENIGCHSMRDCTKFYDVSCGIDKSCYLDKKEWAGSPAATTLLSLGCEYEGQPAVGLCGGVFCRNPNDGLNTPRCQLGTPTANGIKQIMTTFTQGKPDPVKEPFKMLDPLINLQIKIPGLDKIASETPATCETTGDQTSCSLPWIAVYIKAIYNYAMGIIGILAALALMIGGVIYLTATGNATRISEAKSWITGALTGMLIMFTSYVLLNEVNPDLIGLKPIKLQIVSDDLETQLENKAAGLSSKGSYNLKCLEEKYMRVTYNNTPCTADNPKGYFACYDCTPISGTQTVKLNTKNYTLVIDAATALQKAINETPASVISGMDMDISSDGGWVCRSNVNSKSNPKAPSAHAYGVGMDVMSAHPNNANRGPKGTDGKCLTDTPIEFINAMKNNGFRWGGDYKKSCDSMHFEYLAGCASS